MKSGLFKLHDRLFHLCLERPISEFVFIPMIMASHMTPLRTFCEFGSG